MNDLRERAIRGGLARVVAQAVSLPLRLGSLMVLARLLNPTDFGLVGMVTAVTGVFGLLKDFGLSTAAVQRDHVTEEQMSTLFWVNVLVGVCLCALSVASAPIVAAFYREPRLARVMAVLAFGFVVNAAGVQHSVLLQRQMRFAILSVVDVVALFISVIVAVGMARTGFGYWSLVAMTVSLPALSTIGYWTVTLWLPGKPQRNVGIPSMVRFGGTLTLNVLVVYVAYNLEKVLLGRFWGASVVGLYGRAYQLISIPNDNLNTAIGGVAVSALSRVQNDVARLRNYFLKSYSLVLTITLPITVASMLLADDLISVVLGPKWAEAAVIFRLLAPTILIFALINPLGWLLISLGRVRRSLNVALVLAPVVIFGYVVGLPYGPRGVALGYSTMTALWVVPHIVWCVRGTGISLRDIAGTVVRPLCSSVVAALLAFIVLYLLGQDVAPLVRVVAGAATLALVYAAMLVGVMGQGHFYYTLLEALRRDARQTTAAEMSASA